MSLTPQSHTTQLKLRSSCNACGQAKTRCDRAQPACTRCIAQGLVCIYGISRKAGKPPRRRPAVVAPSPYPSRSTVSEATLLGGDMLDLAVPGADNADLMLGLPSAMAVDSPFPAPDWFAFDSLGSASDGGQSSTTATTATTASSTAAEAVAGRPHCTREAKDVMRRLYCANPSAPVSDGVPARTLDLGSVLTRNRDVVARLARLLTCPCALSPHTAMLYSSIVSRVLLWYQQAVSQETSSLPANSPLLGLKVDDSNVSVLPTPVTVGTFQSDDDNLQTALSRCLILAELRRVGDLIDAFIALGTATLGVHPSDACPAAGEFSCAVDASLFASLGTWLRTEHGRIVDTARSGLSVLDENLGSI